jgi:alpha-soluble NSF attachment protein
MGSREASCRQHANETNDAMNAFKNAANAYKKTNPEGRCRPLPSGLLPRAHISAAVSALHQAIKLLIQAGNFRQAADREKEVSSHFCAS